MIIEKFISKGMTHHETDNYYLSLLGEGPTLSHPQRGGSFSSLDRIFSS